MATPKNKVQLGVWLSVETAAQLKRLAADRGLSATKTIELAIAALAGQPAEKATIDSDLRNRVNELVATVDRMNARLTDLERTKSDSCTEVGSMSCSGEKTAKNTAMAESKAIHESGKRRQKQPERDAEIIRLFESGVTSSPAISEALFNAGIVNSKGAPVQPSVILDVLKKAGLR